MRRGWVFPIERSLTVRCSSCGEFDNSRTVPHAEGEHTERKDNGEIAVAEALNAAGLPAGELMALAGEPENKQALIAGGFLKAAKCF